MTSSYTVRVCPNFRDAARQNPLRLLLCLILALSSFPVLSQVTSITNVSVTSIQNCSDEDIVVQFDAVAVGTNAYTVTLSDALGGFPGIGFVSADFDGDRNAQSVNLAIPSGAITGDQYIVMVSAESGSVSGTSLSFTITAKPSASIAYAGSPYCTSLAVIQSVALSGTNAYMGGTFSSIPEGLTINVASGAITPSTSTAGTYTVRYDILSSGGCATVQATTSVIITALPVADFGYSGPLCKNSVNPSPAFLNGGVAGTFTASPAGMSINASSGQIDIASTLAGTYQVTNSIPSAAGCNAVASMVPVTINALPTASNLSSATSTTNINTGAVVTLTSTTLASGDYFVTYQVSGTNSISSTTAAMQFGLPTSTTGTFTTSNLLNAGSSNTVTITGIAFASNGCQTSVNASTPSFVTVFGYTSKQNGDWNDPATWSPQPPPGLFPDHSTDVVTILNGQAVTVPAGLSVSIDQVTVQGILNVAAGGHLNVVDGVGTDLTLLGASARLNISGTLEMSNGATTTGHTITNTQILAGGTYRHAYTTSEGSVPTATWNLGSTLEVAGYTTFGAASPAGNWTQSFGSVSWNCPSQTSVFAFGGLLRTIGGNLNISNTGSGRLELATDQVVTINVGGDVNVSGSSLVYFSNSNETGNSIENFTMNIGNDFNYTSTAVGPEGVGGLLNDKRRSTFNINGDFILNAPGGRLTLSTKTTNQNSDDGTTFNVRGNFSIVAGSFFATESNSGRMGDIFFIGTPGTQHDFTNLGSIIGSVNYYVKRGNILRMVGESALVSSNGNFELGEAGTNTGATLILESTATGGAIQRGTGIGPGNIRVGNNANRRRFLSNSIIIYRGSSKQYMGDGQPGTFGSATDELTTIIDNPASVSVVTSAQTQTITVAGALNFENGNLEFAPTLNSGLSVTGAIRLTNGTIHVTSTAAIIPTLAIGGDLQGTQYFQFTGTNAVVSITGTAPTIFSRNFPIDVPLAVREFIMNRPNATIVMPQGLTTGGVGVGGLTLVNGNLRMNASLTVVNNTILSIGNLYFENQTVDLQGAISTAPTGQFSCNSSSTLTISSASTTSGNLLRFASSGNVLGTFHLNRSAPVTPHTTLATTLLITGTFNLTDGEFYNQSGLGFAPGALLIRTANAAFAPTSAVPAGGPYNLVLNDGTAPAVTSLTTGVEAQGLLNNVTSNCTGTVLLNSSMGAVGAFTVASGTFTCQANPVSVGNCVNNGTLNASSSTFALSGDFVNNSVFNHNAGTVVFGGVSSILGTNNPIFHHATINGSSTLISPESLDIEGNFTNNGEFTAGGSTQIWFRGTLAQTISGSTVTNFNNINVTNTTGVSVESAQNMAGTLSVGPNGTFDADGSNNAVFTLLSTADDPAVDAQIGPLIDNADVSGSVRIQRFVGSFPRIYRYLSSPVSNATVGSWSDNIAITGNFTGTKSGILCGFYLGRNPSLFYYQPGADVVSYEGYVPYPTNAVGGLNAPLIPGRGYAAFVRDCTPRIIDVRGPINKGDFSYSFISNTDAPVLDGVEVNPPGFNLIGNPYPSAIDWASAEGWMRNENVSTIAFIRNNKGNGYISLDSESGSPQLIAMGQGFWMEAIGDGPSLLVKEQAKSSEDGSFKRSGAKLNQIAIILSDNENSDKAVARLRHESSFARDRFDGGKLKNDFFDVFTISDDKKQLSVNTIPEISCDRPLHVGIRNLSEGEYRFTFEKSGEFIGYDISVRDKYLDTQTLIRDEDYSFIVDSTGTSAAMDRFSIYLIPGAEIAPVNPLFSSVSCEGLSTVELPNTRKDVSYEILSDDFILSRVDGNGGTVFFEIPRPAESGEHLFRIQSVAACGAVIDFKTISVKFSQPNDSLIAVNSNLCSEGPATLRLLGLDDDDTALWYESASGDSLVHIGREFKTPILTKTRTYFAEVINQAGCASARIPVTGNVVKLHEPEIIQMDGNILTTRSGEEVEWMFEDVSVGKSVSLGVVENGRYTAIVTSMGCSAQAEVSIVITGLEDGVTGNQVVYPNPAEHYFDLSDGYENRSQISLFDLAGRTHILAPMVSGGLRFDIRHVRSGTYFLMIETEGIRRIIKFIKI